MVTDAGKDALAHTTENAGRVARGLVYAELDVLAAEEKGASTEQDGGCLCGYARAGAAFREDEGDGFVEERLRGHTQTGFFLVGLRDKPGERCLLEGVRMADHSHYLWASQVGHRHQMRDPRHGSM